MGLSQKYVDDLFRERHNERQRISAQKKRDKEKKPAPKPLTKEEKNLLAWAKKEKKDIESGKHGKMLLDKVNKIIENHENTRRNQKSD